MKKIILLILIGLGAWNAYDKHSASSPNDALANSGKTNIGQAFAGTTTSPSFSCDGRVHCSEMTSRAEAEYFSNNCPGTKMDGDHDGDPCENDSRF
jgi:hypothetical protein